MQLYTFYFLLLFLSFIFEMSKALLFQKDILLYQFVKD